MTRTELQTLIATQLKNYADDRRGLSRLEETLECYTDLTEEDIMDDLSDAADHVHTSDVCATTFHSVQKNLNPSRREELARGIAQLRVKLDRLKACVMALPTKQRDVLVCLYFDERSWQETAAVVGVARNTLAYRRKCAIEAILKMPSYYYLLYLS